MSTRLEGSDSSSDWELARGSAQGSMVFASAGARFRELDVSSIDSATTLDKVMSL